MVDPRSRSVNEEAVPPVEARTWLRTVVGPPRAVTALGATPPLPSLVHSRMAHGRTSSTEVVR